MLTGGEMLIRSLEAEGVDVMFGYPGGAALHIYDALFHSNQLHHILTRHEQAAVHAADGYARSTGKVGVALVTSGPGATNAITGIATAFTDSVPLVVVSGQVQSHLIGSDSFQETDMVGISRPIVKHSYLVTDERDIPETIWRAFHLARSGRPGPVVVDIPKDKTGPTARFPFAYPERVEMRSYKPTTQVNMRQVVRATRALQAARRPVILAGGGVMLSDASQELRELAAQMRIPVTPTLMALGTIPGTDPLCLGMPGMHGTYEANMALHHADLILSVGARFDDRVTNDPKRFAPDATILHVDVDPANIGKIIRADVSIVGPAQAALQALLQRHQARPPEDEEAKAREAGLQEWHARIADWRRQHGLDHDLYKKPQSPNGMLMPQAVVQQLWQITGGQPDVWVTSDVGQHQMFAAQYYHFDQPRRWINSGGLGTMGFGLPAAMGAQLAFRDHQVVCITGEGSIQMNLQELSTCQQYGLPIKIVNINNQALGMIKQWQDMQYDSRYSQATYQNSLPDFVKLAEAYGHVGYRVERPEDLEGVLREGLALRDRLVFFDILVDPDEHVYPMHVAPNGSMRDMWLSRTHRT